MPTYEYRCSKCGHQFEVFQKITDKPVKKCPECGAKAERLISGGVGLVFKGSGFYITDYKKKERAEAKSGGGNSGGGDASSAGGGSGGGAKAKAEDKTAKGEGGAGGKGADKA